jgi:glutathione synthase
MRQRNSIDRDSLHFVPFTLLPTPFPRQEFERAVYLQPLLQDLMFKVNLFSHFSYYVQFSN